MPEGAGNPNPDPNPNPNPNKVYNGSGGHQVKTGKVMDNTINPEFWTSFELSAMLPGQA